MLQNTFHYKKYKNKSLGFEQKKIKLKMKINKSNMILKKME